MKTLLSTLLICLCTLSLQAQSLYFSANAGNQFDYLESTYIGFTFDIPSDIDLHVFSGFSQNFAKGKYIGVGVGLEYVLPDPLSIFGLSTPFGIKPIAMGNIRGVFGEFESSKMYAGTESEATLAYNIFLGLNWKAISAGVSIEQYLNDKRIFLNPLSFRFSF